MRLNENYIVLLTSNIKEEIGSQIYNGASYEEIKFSLANRKKNIFYKIKSYADISVNSRTVFEERFETELQIPWL